MGLKVRAETVPHIFRAYGEVRIGAALERRAEEGDLVIETIIFGAVLFGMYIVNGSAVMPAMAAGAAAAAMAGAAALLAVKKDKARAKGLALRAALLACTVPLIYGAMYLNAGKAARGAERLAAACEEYKAKTGAYPEDLCDLVPVYLDSVPRAKATVMWSRYRLRGHRVMYALDPWIMMAGYYDLEEKRPGFARLDEMLAAK